MRPFFTFLLILIFTNSCSKQSDTFIPSESNNSIPFYIIFENEIRGDVLGSPLNEPIGLAVDFKGDIYVSDAGNNRIVKFDSLLQPVAQIGGFGSREGSFNYPTYLAFDNALNLLVSDEQNRRISRFNMQLQFVDNLDYRDDDDLNKFGYPSGIAFTTYGELWIADRQNNQISIFNNIGTFDQILGDFGYSGGQLKNPESIRRDREGNFMVCDAGNQRLVWYDEYGNFEDELKSKDFLYITAAVDNKENYFIVDSDAGQIYATDKKKRIIAVFGPTLPGDSRPFKNPTDVVLYQKDKILITDTGNNRIVLGKIFFEK